MSESIPDEQLAIDVEQTDSGTTLIVRGELDAVTAAAIHDHIAAVEDGNVGLDLGDVTFIDSTGLAAIIEGHLRLASRQRRLVILNRSSAVQRVLDLSGVTGRLDLDPH